MSGGPSPITWNAMWVPSAVFAYRVSGVITSSSSHRADLLACYAAEEHRHLGCHQEPRVAGLVVGDSGRDPLRGFDERPQAVDPSVPLQHLISQAGLGMRSVPAVTAQKPPGTAVGRGSHGSAR